MPGHAPPSEQVRRGRVSARAGSAERALHRPARHQQGGRPRQVSHSLEIINIFSSILNII